MNGIKISAAELERRRLRNCETTKIWSKNNPEKVKVNRHKYDKKRIRLHKEFLYDYKERKGCKHCGLNNPICLEFHHLDRKTKEGCVSKILNKTKVLKEIKKCIVLCRNCHIIEEDKQRRLNQ